MQLLPAIKSRQLSVEIMRRVHRGAFASAVLAKALDQGLQRQDKAFITDLVALTVT